MSLNEIKELPNDEVPNDVFIAQLKAVKRIL